MRGLVGITIGLCLDRQTSTHNAILRRMQGRPSVPLRAFLTTFSRRLLESVLRISSVACETARTHGQLPPVVRVPVLSVLALATSA